jgi:hypothetical protein
MRIHDGTNENNDGKLHDIHQHTCIHVIFIIKFQRTTYSFKHFDLLQLQLLMSSVIFFLGHDQIQS